MYYFFMNINSGLSGHIRAVLIYLFIRSHSQTGEVENVNTAISTTHVILISLLSKFITIIFISSLVATQNWMQIITL